VYRGTIAWNRTRKRNRWGIHKQAARPEGEWLNVSAPTLRIVSEDLWTAVHARLATVRAVYLTATGGQPFGRPALGGPSKYLLTNSASCGCCGGTLHVVSRSHGAYRKRFYGCAGFHERGTCDNRADVPMAEADDILIEALLDDVLDDSMVVDAVDEALSLIQGNRNDTADRAMAIEARLAAIEQERDRLAAAIASGGTLEALLSALQTRERERMTYSRSAMQFALSGV